MEWSKPRTVTIDKIDYPRGSLSVLETDGSLPFEPVDACWLTGESDGTCTEGRAYFSTNHAIAALSGSLKIATEYNGQTKLLTLSKPDEITYIPAMTWFEITEFSVGAVALIVSDALPDALDVITDRHEFDSTTTDGID